MTKLDHGAVALLDALGIKRSWSGPSGTHDTSALSTLKAMKDVVEAMRKYCDNALIPRVLESEFARYGRPQIQTAVFSDTIAVTATLAPVHVADEVRDGLDALLIDMVCQCAGYVLRLGAQAPRPLVYRGVVTCADVLVESPFFLGPAIDSAAQQYEEADGAFVWLAQSALDRVRCRRTYPPHVWETMVFEYAVPMKKGTPFTTIVLTPFVDTADAAEVATIRAGMMRAMDDPDAGVVRKRENTMRFIDTVLAAAARPTR